MSTKATDGDSRNRPPPIFISPLDVTRTLDGSDTDPFVQHQPLTDQKGVAIATSSAARPQFTEPFQPSHVGSPPHVFTHGHGSQLGSDMRPMGFSLPSQSLLGRTSMMGSEPASLRPLLDSSRLVHSGGFSSPQRFSSSEMIASPLVQRFNEKPTLESIRFILRETKESLGSLAGDIAYIEETGQVPYVGSSDQEQSVQVMQGRRLREQIGAIKTMKASAKALAKDLPQVVNERIKAEIQKLEAQVKSLQARIAKLPEVLGFGRTVDAFMDRFHQGNVDGSPKLKQDVIAFMQKNSQMPFGQLEYLMDLVQKLDRDIESAEQNRLPEAIKAFFEVFYSCRKQKNAQDLIRKAVNSLPKEVKEEVCHRVYEANGSPVGKDPIAYGLHHSVDDLGRLEIIVVKVRTELLRKAEGALFDGLVIGSDSEDASDGHPFDEFSGHAASIHFATLTASAQFATQDVPVRGNEEYYLMSMRAFFKKTSSILLSSTNLHSEASSESTKKISRIQRDFDQLPEKIRNEIYLGIARDAQRRGDREFGKKNLFANFERFVRVVDGLPMLQEAIRHEKKNGPSRTAYEHMIRTVSPGGSIGRQFTQHQRQTRALIAEIEDLSEESSFASMDKKQRTAALNEIFGKGNRDLKLEVYRGIGNAAGRSGGEAEAYGREYFADDIGAIVDLLRRAL